MLESSLIEKEMMPVDHYDLGQADTFWMDGRAYPLLSLKDL